MPRTEAVALVEAKGLTWRENDLTNRFRKVANSPCLDQRIRLRWSRLESVDDTSALQLTA